MLPLFCSEVTALEKLTHLAGIGQIVSKDKGRRKVIESCARVGDVTQWQSAEFVFGTGK